MVGDGDEVVDGDRATSRGGHAEDDILVVRDLHGPPSPRGLRPSTDV